MPLILPPKTSKRFDQQVQPVPGTRGSCMLCGKYGELSNSHVFPRAVGNSGKFRAFGFNATSTGQFESLIPRTFGNGISFRTLCRDCNSSLGGNEDQVINDFFDQARAALKPSPLIVTDPYLIRTKPNRLYRAVLAYFATANDTGRRTRLDNEISRAFMGGTSLRNSDLRVYYWPYSGPSLTVIRDIMVSYNFVKDSFWINVLKFKPLGFAVTDRPQLSGLPSLNTYLSYNVDAEADIPFWRKHRENDFHWPANPGQRGAILCSSESPNFVAVASWRNIRVKPL